MQIDFGFQGFNQGSIPPSPIPPDPIPLTFVQAATVNRLLFVPTYYNGPANDGIGATLTASQNGILSDGSSSGKIDYNYTAQIGDIILIKNQVSQLTNGLYEVIATGSSTSPYQLRRSSENDTSSELFPLQVNVLYGPTNNLKYFTQITPNPTIGTSPLVFDISSQQSLVNPILFVDTATSAPLPTCVYTPGLNPSIAGVGATLEASSNGALGSINGLTATTNQNLTTGFYRILVKNELNAAYNGVYQVTSAGSSTTKWKLTRLAAYASSFYRYTQCFFVSNTGSTLAGKYYFTQPQNPPLNNTTIGTSPINIVEYGGSGAGGYNLIQDEGSSLPARTTIDFQGAGVTASDDGSKTIVTIPGSNTIIGENYVVVYAGDDWIANGIELQNALTTARSLNPNGYPISDLNRVTIVCYPGYYDLEADFLDFGENKDEYINLVSITGNCDVKLISTLPYAINISVLTSNNFVGINTRDKAFRINVTSNVDIYVNCKNCIGGDYSFGTENNFALLGTFENCIGGDYSFGSGDIKDPTPSPNGKYINCIAGNYSFGNGASINGTFQNCTAGDYSFGYNITADFLATFEDCKGGTNCFGDFNGADTGLSSTAISNMINCIAGEQSFFVNSYRSSTIIFKNCVGLDYCFNYNCGVIGVNVNNNSHYSCVGQNYCFGVNTIGYENVKYYNCVANDYSFQHTSGAHYYGCVGNDYCFQGSSGISTGIFCQDCVAHDYSFGYVQCSGFQYQNCSANEYSFGSDTGICGSYGLKYCSAIANSFGSPGGSIIGKLHWCYLRDTTFATVSGGGRTFYCVGNDTPNNQ